jgi:prepilin-type N-terminal cleavage/methylation domain-containing protein
MKRRAGFTLIELLITITIMVILLTLTVVGLRTSQANARDEERKTDIASIAQQLEEYYQSGPNDAAFLSPHAVRLAGTSSKLAVFEPTISTGVYPATSQMSTEALVKTTLRDLDTNALRDPSTPAASPISLTIATDTTVPSLASLSSGKKYIYQPLADDGSLCTSSSTGCRKFNLYYTLETNATVLKVVSKHQ